MKLYLIIITLTVLWSVNALAGIIYVPQDQPAIQDGINAAINGDTVLVADSTYYENINFKGKAITVASHYIINGDTNHITNTVINGGFPIDPDSGSVVSFISGEDTTSILCGFTITGGTGTYSPPQPPNPPMRSGGGINCEFSGARICHNKIEHNSLVLISGVVGGGGVSAGPPGNTYWIIMKKNNIRWNSINGMFGAGGGVSLISNAKVYNNVIENNTGQASQNIWGCGISIGSGDPGTIIPHKKYVIGNTIRHNSAISTLGVAIGGGLAVFNSPSPEAMISHNNISFNEIQSNVGSVCYGGGVTLQDQNAATVFANNYVAFNKAATNTICWGAGICIWSFSIPCNPYLINNIITDNTNGTNGGGIYTGGNWTNIPNLVNNTISRNSATLGGAIYSSGSNIKVENSILWNNGTEIYQYGGIVTVEYSNVQGGGWPGPGNIDADPMLYDSTMSPGDTIYSCLPSNSPCVDSANPDPVYNDPEDPNNPGFALWPAMGGLRNDMGAYGGPGGVITGIDDDLIFSEKIPTGFQLYQNYPNPFNPTTNIEFSIPKSEFVTLKIYNILGEVVATLVSQKLAAGKYKYDWDAGNLASGVYLYRIQAGNFVEVKKMLLMK